MILIISNNRDTTTTNVIKLEYIKSGDCPPLDYSMMVDGYKFSPGKSTYYGMGRTFLKEIDSAAINRHRKNMGLPSLKHTAIIKKDFFKHLKENEPSILIQN